MTRRHLLAGMAIGAAHAQQRRRPNFVFILADDHAGYAMGCDGNAVAITPNLDRLAREGTRFAAHYCNSPVCTPSRQSFFTGQLPHSAGVTVLGTALSAEKPTLAKQFKKAGYKTAVFGKMHFNRPAEAGLHGFDTMMTENEIARAWNAEVKPRAVPAELPVKPARWQPFKDPARVWLNADALPFARVDAEMRGTFIGRKAIEYLEANREQSFALWVSFQEPHSPFDFPVEDAGLYQRAKMRVPVLGPQDAGQIPLEFRGLSNQDKGGIIASYYTSVAFLDRNVGRVLEALRRLKLEENTCVVYMADHGYSLGQHGRFEKHCGYDPAMRVPLIVRYPGRVRQGVVADMTEHVDVSATICDLMGLDALPVLHGQSLRPYMEARPMPRARDHVFSEYLENEEAYVRTAEWKYVFCTGKRARTDGYKTDDPTPGRYTRLYDLTRDPAEFFNVAATHRHVADRLESLMLARFRATHPERETEPQRLNSAEALEFYLRPRDAK